MDILLPLLAVFLWGGNAVVTKASAGLIGPVEISFYRWLVAAVLLAPMAVRPILRNPVELRQNLLRLIVLGLMGCALFPYLMYLAARHTSAINIGIIQTVMPLFAIGLLRTMFGAPISRNAVLGAVISLIGVAVVVSQGHPFLLFSQQFNRGDLIMLAATACFALYSVLLERWRSALPMTTELFVQSAAAVAALFPAFLFANHEGLNQENFPLVVYAGALASIVAPLVWMKGIDRIGPARASLFFNLLPVVTAVFAVAILGEPVSGALMFGGALAIAGVALSARGGRAEASGQRPDQPNSLTPSSRMQTAFGSVKACTASLPNSRPRPDNLLPPKGIARSRTL